MDYRELFKNSKKYFVEGDEEAFKKFVQQLKRKRKIDNLDHLMKSQKARKQYYRQNGKLIIYKKKHKA